MDGIWKNIENGNLIENLTYDIQIFVHLHIEHHHWGDLHLKWWNKGLKHSNMRAIDDQTNEPLKTKYYRNVSSNSLLTFLHKWVPLLYSLAFWKWDFLFIMLLHDCDLNRFKYDLLFLDLSILVIESNVLCKHFIHLDTQQVTCCSSNQLWLLINHVNTYLLALDLTETPSKRLFFYNTMLHCDG